MRIFLTLFASFLMAASAALCQQKSNTKTARQQTPAVDPTEADFQKTAQATIRWEQSSTPGAKADAELVKKGEVNGHNTVEYRLKVSGASNTSRYLLTIWPITYPAPIFMMDGLAVAKDGTVGCPADSTATCGQRIKGKELLLTYSPGLGEIYRHALISDDKKSKIFFSIIPFPLVEEDKACSLEVVELKPGFGLVLVRGRGFQPGEPIQFHAQSYQDVHNAGVKADAHGAFEAPYTPWVKGRTTGASEISATSKSCAPKISFNWGAGQ
jgi:hypothetical protein